MANQVPVAEGLFAETADGPRLLGSTCATCHTPYFPKATMCRNPECKASKLEDAAFGPHGKLWSYSVQYYPPPPPAKYVEPYSPYALAMVDMDEGLRVLSRISTPDPESVRPGMDLELLVDRLYVDGEGNDVMTWMFRPI